MTFVLLTLLISVLLALPKFSMAKNARPWTKPGTKAGEEIVGPDGGTYVWVPPGEFMMGSDDERDNAKPVHKKRITKGFWLSKFEVSNEQYARFLNTYGKNEDHEGNRLYWDNWGQAAIQWKGGKYELEVGGERHPAVDVSWYGAKAYCDFYDLRLPTEAEWEYAARGPKSFTYPWGNEWDEKKCVFRPIRVLANVGSIVAGKSWCGAHDMAGNADEWCAEVITRGGSSFHLEARDLRSAYRIKYHLDADNMFHSVGFRPAVTPLVDLMKRKADDNDSEPITLISVETLRWRKNLFNLPGWFLKPGVHLVSEEDDPLYPRVRIQIIGKNLPKPRDAIIQIEDRHLVPERNSIRNSPESLEILAEGEDAEGLEFDVSVKPGAIAGEKKVTINGASNTWIFLFPDFLIDVERQDGLMLGIFNILKALGVRFDDLLEHDILWTPIQGRTVTTLDRVRLKELISNFDLTDRDRTFWETRINTSDNWVKAGEGRKITLAVPEQTGKWEIRGTAIIGKSGFVANERLEIVESACQRFYARILLQLGDGIHFFRKNYAKFSKTYASKAPPKIPLKNDPKTGKPFELQSGDVILRTAGTLSSVMRTMGSPDAPQTHSGILQVIRTRSGKKLHLVHHVVEDGKRVDPLTPADAEILKEEKHLSTTPISYIAEASVGTIQVWRPKATAFPKVRVNNLLRDLRVTLPFKLKYPEYAREVEERLDEVEVKGYDFMFLESSIIVREEPTFKGWYYCHEYVREVLGLNPSYLLQFGTGILNILKVTDITGNDQLTVEPRTIQRLARLWQAAVACDRESADSRGMHSPSALLLAIDKIDWEEIYAKLEETDNEQVIQLREQLPQLLSVIRSILKGQAFKDILHANVLDSVRREIKPHQDRLMAVADTIGVEPHLRDLYFSGGLRSDLKSWIEASKIKIADRLVDQFISDLSDAIGARQLLGGGVTINRYGQITVVRFEQINLPF